MSNASPSQWFYAVDRQQYGPVPRSVLDEMIATGRMTPTDLVWCDGMPRWEQVGTVFPEALASMKGLYHAGPQPVVTSGAGGGAGGDVLSYFNPMQTEVMIYSGFWRRFGAFMIDFVILSAAGAVVAMVVYLPLGAAPMVWGQNVGTVTVTGAGGAGPAPGPPAAILSIAWMLNWLLNTAIAWLYEALMTSSRHRGTLGKLVFGVEVVRPNGEPLTFARASGRHFAKWISYYTLLVGYIIAAFTLKKQGLHDFICDTVVIKKRVI